MAGIGSSKQGRLTIQLIDHCRWFRLGFAILLMGITLIVVACGGDDDSPSTASNATSVADSTATAQSTQAGSTAESTHDPTTESSTPAQATPSVATNITESTSSEITITDIVGRVVTLDGPAERIILGEGRQIYIVGMLQPDDPFKNIIGWRDDLMTSDYGSYEKYLEKFPHAADIRIVGNPGAGEFNVEQAIADDADLLLLNLDAYDSARDAGVIDQLEKAGIPTVVIDFRAFPLENTVPSTLIVGKILGAEERAQEFADYYIQQINEVYSRVAQAEGEPQVGFFYRAAGLGDCCGTFGRANLALLFERAGGINYASDKIPGFSGTLNPEEVLVSDVDMIIVTGSDWSHYPAAEGFVSLGYGASEEEAREELRALMEARGWTDLRSVQDGQVYAIWHQFYNSPYHFVVFQQFAKWLYPDLFADLDPQATFDEFHERFLPVENSGTFWVSLNP